MRTRIFIIIASLFFAILYFFFLTGKKYIKAKEIIVFNRNSIDGSLDEFQLKITDSIKKVTSKEDIQFFNQIRRIRKPFIVKKKILGKIITEKGDSVNIVIHMPGAIIVDFETGKKYGFISKKKQKRLAKILGQFGIVGWQ
jgi:hypothetical protein